MNERAAGGVKVCRSIWESVALLSESPAENPYAGDPDDERTAKVLITASLADRPAMMAAAALQSSKPRGARRGATVFPRQARRLLLPSGENWNAVSKDRRNQMMAEAASITVKAFFTKPAALETAADVTILMSGMRKSDLLGVLQLPGL